MVFTVEVVPETSEMITFNWEAKEGTGSNIATEDTDFKASSGTDITIAAKYTFNRYYGSNYWGYRIRV